MSESVSQIHIQKIALFRVDALVKNPEMLLSRLQDGDLKGSLLALKAYFKMAGKM
ncbi:MAG: hypothetical protein ACUVQZ_03715 [Candidatus Caldatribacteriaceae bacterium]